MARLRSRPDAVLVSAETVNDFQLNPGDLIRLRLQDARTHAYRAVPFHYVGIVNEFPTAPKDSFLVANAGYVAAQTGSDAVGTFLVDTGGRTPWRWLPRIRHAGRHQRDGRDHRRRPRAGRVEPDVGGPARLTRLELAFALVIAAASGGLVLGLGIAERRRGIAVATELGASRRQVRRLGVGGAGVVLVVGPGAGSSPAGGCRTCW